jgi:hypothetical protein
LESWQHGIEPQWWCIEKDQYLALLGPFCSFLLFLATFYAKMRKSRVQLIGSLESELPAAVLLMEKYHNVRLDDDIILMLWQQSSPPATLRLRFAQAQRRKINLHIFL